MPSLDDEQQKRLKAGLFPCAACGAELRQNYCRGCDLFFYEGHRSDCTSRDDEHTGHRTY
jgi:hypothetical protein